MLFDGWSKWLRQWRGIGPRKAAPRGRRGCAPECLEERFLLGELVPATLPAASTAPVPGEVSVFAPVSTKSTEFSPLPVIQIPSIPVSTSIDQSDAAKSASQVQQADRAEATSGTSRQSTSSVSSSKVSSDQPLASDLRAGKAASRADKRAAKAAAKVESKRQTDRQQALSGTSSGSSSSHSSVETEFSSSGSIGTSTGGSTSTTTTTTATPTDFNAAASAGVGVSSTGTAGTSTLTTEGTTNTTISATSTAHSSESLAALMADPQLTTTEVEQLLDRASAATPSEDAIIVIVDRQGNILGVRTETAVPTADLATLVFSIDGAVAEARTAAFFSNNQAPITSRTVRFISQTTITEREVDSNPSISDMSSTEAGPGYVAPIGLGGHFPPGVAHTPVVDLFGIEHTNRDSIDAFPGGEGRFNADYVSAAQEINAPGSYGVQSGLMLDAQPRGIATLPGGIPLFRDCDGNGVGDTLIGGIGVFFPGPDGYASYEQGFVHGDNKTAVSRTNASRVLEAEFIALAAIGSSRKGGVVAGPIDGVAPVAGIDLPFGRIDLVGIQLEIVGPTAGIEGLKQLLKFGTNLGTGVVNGTDQMVTLTDTYLAGEAVPTGWLVAPHGSGLLTAADVMQIINQGITEALRVRAAIRLPIGSRTRMVFAVTDTSGEVLGLYRMDDATYFSLDVAVAKARNMAYYADSAALDPADQVLTKKGVAFTSRTVRFLAGPRYPVGVDGARPGPFSILNEPSINPKNAENLGAAAPASAFTTVLGYDSFNIGTNFRDASSPSENQNGVVFFPGSSALYKGGVLVGGLGVSGDGVDQDDVVTVAAARGFNPPSTLKADRYTYKGVRLPYTKFLRNPYG